MKRIWTVTVLASILILGSIGLSQIPSAFAQISITQGSVLSIDPIVPFIYKINPDTGATISSVKITLDGTFLDGLTVNGGLGIAFNPDDEKVYALLALSPDPDTCVFPDCDGGGKGLTRHLVTINPLTGVATLVGDTGVKKIASLAFNSGTLYSVKLGGSDKDLPNKLSTISTVDGSVTTKCDLNAEDGTGLTFNPDDGLLYYTTEGEFQRINNFNVDPCDVTDIVLIPEQDNPSALTFINSFLIVNDFDELLFIANNNDIASIDLLDEDSRGLTVVLFDIIIGGEIIPLDNSALVIAGVQSVSMWMIPVILTGIGIGVFVIMRTRK